MATKDLRDLNTPELRSKLDDAREELFKLRFQLKTGQLTDYSRLRAMRRRIAQMATLLRERELAAELTAAAQPAQGETE